MEPSRALIDGLARRAVHVCNEECVRNRVDGSRKAAPHTDRIALILECLFVCEKTIAGDLPTCSSARNPNVLFGGIYRVCTDRSEFAPCRERRLPETRISERRDRWRKV